MTSRPIRSARSGTAPRLAARSFTKSFWVVKARSAPRSRAQARQVGHVGGGVGDDGRGRSGSPTTSPQSGVERPAEPLRVADPAERRDASGPSRPSSGSGSTPGVRSGRAARAGPRPSAAGRPAARPRRRIAVRSAASTRSARDRTTTPARRSDPTGSRSRPRGKSRPRPNGSRASSRTMSRSRASRRCWKPSSRTSSSRLQLLDGDPRPAPTRSGSWRWGTSGRFSSRTRPSSFSPVAWP